MKLKNFLTALVSTFALTALLDTASVTELMLQIITLIKQ